jgi:hypothetical protein
MVRGIATRRALSLFETRCNTSHRPAPLCDCCNVRCGLARSRNTLASCGAQGWFLHRSRLRPVTLAWIDTKLPSAKFWGCRGFAAAWLGSGGNRSKTQLTPHKPDERNHRAAPLDDVEVLLHRRPRLLHQEIRPKHPAPTARASRSSCLSPTRAQLSSFTPPWRERFFNCFPRRIGTRRASMRRAWYALRCDRVHSRERDRRIAGAGTPFGPRGSCGCSG